MTVPERLHAYHEDVGYYEERATGLLASARDGTDGAVAAFARVGAPLTEDGARLVLAREHGVGSWDELAAHVAGLRAAGDPFAAAYRAIEARDVTALAALLDAHPDLVTARGTNGNDLLGMAGAMDDDRLLDVLLERGADLRRGNAHGWTVLHQAAYGGRAARARRLVEAGAPVGVSARGDGGTPLIVALFWGHRETAELLAGYAVVPRNLRAAAGLGDLELIDALGPEEAGAHRAFYRPHGGFPDWRPTGDPQEVLDEALAWAARSDRADAVERLVERGANFAADVYRGTALAWAAACGRVATIRRLVTLGADPNQRATFGGPDHGEQITALHLAAQNGDVAAVSTLLEVGADPSIADGLYGGTPAGWAEHFGHTAAKRLLESGG